MDRPTSYPLSWPLGWTRTPPGRVRRAKFDRDRSVAQAIEFLQGEMRRLGVTGELVISTNIEPRLDRLPRSGGPQPADRGAAVYFVLQGRQQVLACDRWDRVEDNLYAIAKHIEALRALDRHGVGTLEMAFMGYKALPSGPSWWDVLGVRPEATLEQVEAAYLRLATEAHPDRGGSTERMAAINDARDAARRAISARRAP